jgi:hypothetical protein
VLRSGNVARSSLSKTRLKLRGVELRLVELGLLPKARQQARRKLRAQELATKAIAKIIDPTASPDEQAQRWRLLTKGPTEFREARVNQPRAKGK